ncbi:MAG: hypothetical protein KKH94_05950 [Candidatus Omnitrophica bacterium]|nr:hypothetical protein [Candidatus Omnitrophota bacterium]
MQYKKPVTILILLCIISGCSSVGSYHSFQLYNKPLVGDVAYQAIHYDGLERNPVIVIPGIFGSRLSDATSGEEVWGSFTGKEALKRLKIIKTSQMRLFSLPMAEERPLAELCDTVISTGILNTVNIKLFGISFHVNAYQDMLGALKFGGYYDETFKKNRDKKYYTCFQFGYDWRRDLVENSERLHAFIQEKKAYLQSKYEEMYGVKDYDVQFDIVAHSMGGLIARYYLRYGGQDLPQDGSLPKLTWEGSKHVDKVIMIGTPNMGYLDALIELVNGLVFIRGMPKYESAVLGTFPTFYQMLPLTSSQTVVDSHGEALDVFDYRLWIDMKWGLADPKQDAVLKILLPDVEDKEKRRSIALDHLRKCLVRAQCFAEALSVKADIPDDVSLHLFLGDAVSTSHIAEVNRKSGKIKIIAYGPGDGKVLASSALMDLRTGSRWVPFVQSPIHWSSVTFLFAAHMGITSDPIFATNVLYLLLSNPPKVQAVKKQFNLFFR